MMGPTRRVRPIRTKARYPSIMLQASSEGKKLKSGRIHPAQSASSARLAV